MLNVYVHNPIPEFRPPEHHNQRPQFIRKLSNYAAKRRVWLWEGFYSILPLNPDTLKPVYRRRRFNEHRGRAMQAVTQCIAHHLNVVTGIAQVSIEMLAHQCGLATRSEAGNKSITRASRAVITMEQYGLLKCEKIWDRTAGTWIPKLIEVTPLFIRMCGLNESEFEAAQRQQLGFHKRGLPADQQEQLTLNEMKRRAREQHRKIAFERRAKQDKAHQARKLARKLAGKELDEQRHLISQNLVKMYGLDEIQRIGLDGFKHLVDAELGRMRRIAADPPPN